MTTPQDLQPVIEYKDRRPPDGQCTWCGHTQCADCYPTITLTLTKQEP